MKQDPTLYEPKSMLCEITGIIGPLLGAGASLIGGSMASSAAKKAAGAQEEAAREAVALGREGLDFQKEVFDISRADLDPYRASGAAALGTLNSLFIPGGQPVVQMQSQLNDLRAQRAVLARTGNQPTPPPFKLPQPLARNALLRGAATQGEGGPGGAR